jgi:hypothetical protein
MSTLVYYMCNPGHRHIHTYGCTLYISQSTLYIHCKTPIFSQSFPLSVTRHPSFSTTVYNLNTGLLTLFSSLNNKRLGRRRPRRAGIMDVCVLQVVIMGQRPEPTEREYPAEEGTLCF